MRTLEGDEPDPRHEKDLKGQANPQQPPRDRIQLRMLQHVDVGWKDGDEEGEQSPAGGASHGVKQKADAAREFGQAADGDEQFWTREIRWHDPQV